MQKITNIKINDLRPYDKNAKIHTAYQIELLVKSINEFGFVNPILIDEDKNVIAGHGRIEAAKICGFKELPAVIIEGLNDIQRRAYILADNRLSELAEWDNKLVAEELQGLHEMNFDTEVTGFSYEDIDFSFLDQEKAKIETKKRERKEDEPCECPRCKCIFMKNEIIEHGNQNQKPKKER